MDRSRERNGSKLPDISETGKIIAKMVLGSNFIRTEINTKACGREIEDTVRELTGETKQESCAENTLEIGLKIESMEEEHSSIKMEIDMMVIGSTDSHKERVE
jgi:hypothetical protein